MIFTGFDKQLLIRFKTILAVISNLKYKINVQRFKDYCIKTAERYVALYKWFYMSPTIHIVLFHGFQMVREFDYPFGIISEEAHESKNKDIKKYRQHYSRKMSR